jgi:hypothetical protein
LILSPPENNTSSLQLFHIPLPGICMFRSITGLPCPGCGLGRSMVAAVHGELARSLEYHRLGFFVLAYIFLQFIYCGSVLAFPKLRQRFLRFEPILNRGLIFLGVLMALNWILTLARQV